MSEPTREELQAQIAALQLQLASHATFVPEPPHATSSSAQTTVTETPQQTTIKTTHAAPTEQQFATVRGLVSAWPRKRKSDVPPEQIMAQIIALKAVITSGVNSAGYGDKRTEFRSLTELRQILNDLEEELEAALGYGGRIRQIRMTAPADKAL